MNYLLSGYISCQSGQQMLKTCWSRLFSKPGFCWFQRGLGHLSDWETRLSTNLNQLRLEMVLSNSRNREKSHVHPTFNTGVLKNHGAINPVSKEISVLISDPSILFASVKMIVEGYFQVICLLLQCILSLVNGTGSLGLSFQTCIIAIDLLTPTCDSFKRTYQCLI